MKKAEEQENEGYWKEEHVSDCTEFKVQTLRNHRHEGRGIPYLKIGRSIRYKPSDVRAFMEKCRIDPEGGAA